MVKIYQGGSTGLEQQRAKRYPTSQKKGVMAHITDSLNKDFDFDLILIQSGSFYYAIDDGAEFLKKHFAFKLYGNNHYTASFPLKGLNKYTKLLDGMKVNYCIADQLEKKEDGKVIRVVSFSTIPGADGLLF